MRSELEVAYPSMEWTWQLAKVSRMNDTEFMSWTREFATRSYTEPVAPNPYMQGTVARLLRIMDERNGLRIS